MSSTTPKRNARLAALFHVQPGEGRLVILLVAHSFFLGVPLVLSETVANTLFLVNFGAAALPYVYIGFAVMSTLTGLIYSRIEARFSFSRLLIANLTTMLLSLCVLRLGLALPGQTWVVAVVAIWTEVLWVLSSLEFGALLGRVFDLRQGKRLFGLVGSGEVIAGIAGGLLVPLVVRRVGTANLLLIGAASLVVAVLLLRRVLKTTSYQLASADTEAAETVAVPGVGLFRNPYIVLIVAFSVLSLFGYFFLDNIFYLQLDQQFTTEEQLASFLGMFYAAQGLLTLLGKAFVTGQLLRRYGVVVSVLAVPVVVAAGAAFTVMTSLVAVTGLTFWLLVLTKLHNEVLKDAVDQPVSLILYQPLAPALRIRAQTVVESVVEPMAGGAAGVLLLLLANLAGVSSFVLLLILGGIVSVWLASGVLLGRGYQATLRQALKRSHIDMTWLSLQDASSRAVVQQSLRSVYPREVLFALDLLQANQDPSLSDALGSLLAHPAPEVRRDVLERIARLRLTEHVDAVAERVALETVPSVREAAIRTLAMVGEASVFDQVSRFLDDPEPLMRRGALTGLLRSGGITGVQAAEQHLIDLAVSAEPKDRVLAAEVLGAAGSQDFYKALLPLLVDPDTDVRRAALLAAGQVKHPQMWRTVIAALTEPELRSAAATALVSGGPAILPEVHAIFADGEHDLPVVRQLSRILGRMPSREIITLLESKLDVPIADWRTYVLGALSACGYRPSADRMTRVVTQLRREAVEATRYIALRADLGDEGTLAILARSLDYEVEQTRLRIFFLLDFLFDATALQQVQTALTYGTRDQRAYAMEIIDSMLPNHLKCFVLPLLEALTPAQRLAQLSAVFPQPALTKRQRIAALITGQDAPHATWLRSCACYVAGTTAPTEYTDVLATAAAAEDRLLRETARWALTQAKRDAYGVVASFDRSFNDPDGKAHQEEAMLTTLEKVIILKTVSIFEATPDVVLAEIAAILREITAKAGETIFAKGDLGTSMYIIVHGKVRVHDGERTLNFLGERAVFGEMALLDPEPRMASVTAVDETRLFRVDHGPFYELMADRVEIARGIIRVLTGYVRARVRDLAELDARVHELELRVPSPPE